MSFRRHPMISIVVTNWKRSNRRQIVVFFAPCNLEIWQMTLKTIRAPLLSYFKLCVSFCSHRWIQTGVIVRKRPIPVKISEFLSRTSLKYWEWPWKTVGHPFYPTSSFLYYFVAIGEFKLELQSGNAQFGSKSAIFRPVWPRSLKDDLKNNRAPLLCHFKLIHHFVAICGVTVGKRSILVKIVNFCGPVWPWNLTDALKIN